MSREDKVLALQPSKLDITLEKVDPYLVLHNLTADTPVHSLKLKSNNVSSVKSL